MDMKKSRKLLVMLSVFYWMPSLLIYGYGGQAVPLIRPSAYENNKR